MLHAKAVPAEGRRAEGPAVVPAVCISYVDGEGEVELTADLPAAVADASKMHSFQQSQLWHWAMNDKSARLRVSGEAVALKAGDRCIVELKTKTGELQSVQAVPRLTGKISSRPSAAVGQIEPDEACRSVAGANVFLRLSQVPGAVQLPAVGERVEFQLAPNPERAEKLWAAEVVPLETDTLASQPIGRVAVTAAVDSSVATGGGFDADAAGGSGGGGGCGSSAEAAPKRDFSPGCRVYVGRLPPDAMWRDVQELFAPFGEIVHLQLPLDDSGRRRGFAIVELLKPEQASAAVEKLEVADLRGTQLVVRLDDAVVNQKSGCTVYVGNLGPTTTWQALKAHITNAGADPTGAARVQVMGENGRSLGFGFVEFRTAAAADAAVWMLHNNSIEADRYLFMRLDCDVRDQDEVEAKMRRDAHAKNIQLVASLAHWIDASPPLVEWGWAERFRSCWAPKMEPAVAPPIREARSHAMAFHQFQARVRQLVTARMEVAQLPGLYEHTYGNRIEPRAFGYPSLREALHEITSGGAFVLDASGPRPTIAPAYDYERVYDRERGDDRQGRDGGVKRERGGERRDRERDRDDFRRGDERRSDDRREKDCDDRRRPPPPRRR